MEYKKPSVLNDKTKFKWQNIQKKFSETALKIYGKNATVLKHIYETWSLDLPDMIDYAKK